MTPREMKDQQARAALMEELKFIRTSGSSELEELNRAAGEYLMGNHAADPQPEQPSRQQRPAMSMFDVAADVNQQPTEQYAGQQNDAVSAAHADRAYSQGELTNLNYADAKVQVQPDPVSHTVDHTLGFRVEGVRPPYRQPRPPIQTENSGKHVTLDSMPSDFAPYAEKTLSIRPFNLDEFKIIADWAATGHPEYVKNAMAATVWPTPLDELTIQDGIALMYFHRSLSYVHSPHTMDWECQPVKTASGDWPGCSHKNYTVLRAENVLITHLSDAHLSFDYSKMHPDFDLPRMSLYEDYVWLQEQLGRYSDYTYRQAVYETELTRYKNGLLRNMTVEKPLPPVLAVPHSDLLVYRAALWLKAGYSLEEKFDILKNSGRADWLQIGLQYDRNLIYGVKEQAAVTCQNCGEKRLFALALDPKAFFP